MCFKTTLWVMKVITILGFETNAGEIITPKLHRKLGYYQTVLDVWHKSSKLNSIKLTIFSHLRIHNIYVMCGWTHFGSPFIFNTLKAILSGPIHYTEIMAILRLFWVSGTDSTNWNHWNSPLSDFCGSIQDMWCVAGLILALLSSSIPPKQPSTGPNHYTENMTIF